MENKHLIEVACEAYCKCCDTKECEDLGDFNDFNCDLVCKFRKEFTKELNKKSTFEKIIFKNNESDNQH